MRIGLLSWILDRKRTGIDNYLYNLLNQMINDKKGDFFLFHFKTSDDPIYKKVNEVIIPTLPIGINIPFRMSKMIKENELDLFHFPFHWPNQISPFFRNSSIKKIITIHDLIPLLFKENLPYYYRLWAPTLKLIKDKTDLIITDSENTKKDCIEYLKIPEDKIAVVYLAVDKKYRVLRNKDVVKQELINKYNLNFPFILYVGNVELRKNVSTLIKSFYQIKNKGFKHKLVIIGAGKYGFNEILSIVRKLDLINEVIFMGYVPDEDLVKFYNTADLFVFPSLYEGFGLPPLEAMACGCPVISSNVSSLPEIIGNAGLLANPNDYNDFSAKISKVLTDNDLMATLIKKGLIRSQLFSWEKTAEQTWNLYEKVLEGRN